MILQKTGMGLSKAEACVLRKIVGGEVILIVCVQNDDIIVAAKDKRRSMLFLGNYRRNFL